MFRCAWSKKKEEEEKLTLAKDELVPQANVRIELPGTELLLIPNAL